jgi:hypothetical protein
MWVLSWPWLFVGCGATVHVHRGDGSGAEGSADDSGKDTGTAPPPDLACWSVNFDAFKDHIEVPTLVDGQPAGTVELWFAAASWEPNATLWSLGNGLPGETFSNAAIGSQDEAPENSLIFGTFLEEGQGWQRTDSGTSPTLGAWTHVAATWSPTGRAIFVDGILAGHSDYGGPIPTGSVVGLLGADANVGHHFGGQIARVRISSSVRHTESFTPARGFRTDGETLAIWHLDEGEGSVVHDASGLGHEGLINTRPEDETTWMPSCPGG